MIRFILLVTLLGLAYATPPEGTPYLEAEVNFVGTFDPLDIQTSVHTWLRASPASDLPGFAGLLLNEVIIYEHSELRAGVQAVNITLDEKYENVKSYDAFKYLAGPFALGAVLKPTDTYPANPLPHVAVAIENPASVVTIGLLEESVIPGYKDSWANNFYIIMSTTPISGKDVVIEITCNDTNLDFSATNYTITYPQKRVEFSMIAPEGDYEFTLSVIGGTDLLSRYSPNATNLLPTWTVGARIDYAINEPVLATYQNADSDDYEIVVPTHRVSFFEAVVTVIADDPSIVTIKPSNNITVRQVAVPAKFQVFATTPGTYTLTYFIADPWEVNGYTYGRSNTDFKQINRTSTVIVRRTINITVTTPPTAHFVNEPYVDAKGALGAHGGVWSEPFTINISMTPRNLFQLTPNAQDVVFVPPELRWQPGNPPAQKVVARALTQGPKTISFVRSGPDQGIYNDPDPIVWNVEGPNRLCHGQTSLSSCFALPSCFWNEKTQYCSNHTLPMFLSEVPELFHLEESLNISLTLATPSQDGLLVTFKDVSGRLVFNPPVLQFAPGDSTFNFTIIGDLGVNVQRVRQPFVMELSGGDANIFTQVEASADVRPLIQCIATPPPPFFVTTESKDFFIVCDTDPETDVTLTPKSLPGTGIGWIPVHPITGDGDVGDGFQMLPGMLSARFRAISTTDKYGSFRFEVIVTGTNAPRLDDISFVSVTVLPSGEVLTPPSFYLTAYDMSPWMHCDISVQAPTVLYVETEVFDEAGRPTDLVTLQPELGVGSTLKFNNTKRNFLRARSEVPGNYTIRFTVTGENKRNYINPPLLDFEVKPRLDGKAFLARTTLGYNPELRCRVQVGYQSLAFKGQTPIASQIWQEGGAGTFCSVYEKPVLNATQVNCSAHVTEERCRHHMETTGNACVWHKNECILLPTMQGCDDWTENGKTCHWIKQVAFGSGFTVLLTNLSKVFTIGETRYGQLGHYSDQLQEVEMPTRLGVDDPVEAITAGTSHTIAVTRQGYLYAWGANQKGQLGTRSRVKQTEKIERVVLGSKGTFANCISCGTLHCGATTTRGQLYMWGSNEFGQLGSESSYRQQTNNPQLVSREYLSQDEPVIALQCGEYHTMVGSGDGKAYTFGSNTMGQLGRPGFDEWKPGLPVHWDWNNKFFPDPVTSVRRDAEIGFKSKITGTDDC